MENALFSTSIDKEQQTVTVAMYSLARDLFSFPPCDNIVYVTWTFWAWDV